MDKWLHFYFSTLLDKASLVGPTAYQLLPLIGHQFRDDVKYASLFTPGVMQTAQHNLQSYAAIANNKIADTLKQYLQFESRFVIENGWIRRDQHRYLQAAFNPLDRAALQKEIAQGQTIVVTAHTTGMYTMVDQLRRLGVEGPFVMMDMMQQNWDQATPLQKNALQLFPEWRKRQSFIFTHTEDVMSQCRDVLHSGQSLVIAPDVPLTLESGVSIDFAGFEQMQVSAGTAVLAKEFSLPILIAIPWAKHCTAPYNIAIGKLYSEENAEQTMQKLFTQIETFIQCNPACWSGWLYF